MVAFMQHISAAALISSWLQVASAAPTNGSASTNSKCHYLPGDRQWPSNLEWQHLNQSVGGRLIAGKPLAAPCHVSEYSAYSAEVCTNIEEQWIQPPMYFDDPVNVMSPYWLNNSCTPFTSPSSSCTMGNLAVQAINVSSAADIIAGVKFANEKNIRLTVKNTGHDYLGRSTGEGALALWTHNLKGVSFLNYSSAAYTGPAAKLMSGSQAFEVYKTAADNGLRVSGGFCPTVGLAGGYVAGAGHGPLEGLYGLAADNTLEFEVVTTEGKHLVASPTENSDLYWALNGGGGSTYAIVVSQTTKAHADGQVAGATLTFNNTNDDSYWAAFGDWQKKLLDFDSIVGFNSFWGVTNKTFVLYYATLPGAAKSDMAKILDPFIQTLKQRNLPYTYSTTGSSNFYGHLSQYTPDLPYGDYTTNALLGGRLIPRSTVQHNLTALIATIRNITNTGTSQFRVNGAASNLSHERVGNKPDSNAILPAWRDSLYWLNMDVYIDTEGSIEAMETLQAKMNENQDQLKVITPSSGAYMNEATYDNPDWKEDYYGVNYDRLLDIKKHYDPSFLLYGPASVGSDHWAVASDGRLCKAT
ncbi:hypothetical protein GGR52DRAFT_569941 [Hypoxylon sp. FL1284]|nr:hypothetical protein GGR52DRAFT_569941 [Hypoxylon sp. FL1284]